MKDLIDHLWKTHPDHHILPIKQWKKDAAEIMEDPRDVCECGDYRYQHDNGGACNLNGLGHGIPFGEGKCEKFRLAYSIYANYDPYDELRKD